MPHKPVLLAEVLAGLRLKPGDIAVDGTLGSGGHAMEMLKRIGPEGKLVGLDQDPASIERCQMMFNDAQNAFLFHANFSEFGKALDSLHIPSVNAVLLDVGFSSDQLEDPSRGFSFERSGPLDMRMNPEGRTTARDLVNRLPEEKLEKIFFEYGEERWGRRFARAICRERSKHFLDTTDDLVNTIGKSLPFGEKNKKGHRPQKARRHPATRVFQALRIAVNDELGVLERSLPRIWEKIRPQGRLAVISFHSLEDRIVKQQFRAWARAKEAVDITRKPIVPSREEVLDNPRSRSAKLRVVEKTGGAR